MSMFKNWGWFIMFMLWLVFWSWREDEVDYDDERE